VGRFPRRASESQYGSERTVLLGIIHKR
jgi:hypothetical protein